MIRLAILSVTAFAVGFAIMFARNARSVEHNAITGTGVPVPRRRVGPGDRFPRPAEASPAPSKAN